MCVDCSINFSDSAARVEVLDPVVDTNDGVSQDDKAAPDVNTIASVDSEYKVELKPSDYVHLHNHTHFSILDGLQKIPEMVERTKEFGMEAIAITDHGSMAGAIDLYKKGKENGVKAIIGCEFYVAARKYTDKDKTKDRPRFHLILLAMNEVGYKNLCKLNTYAWSDGYYFKPRIDHELIEKYSEGVICLSGCIGGEVGDSIRNGNMDTAKELIEWHKSVFGDRYYLELQDHGHQWIEQRKVNDQLLKFSKELDVPVVLTCDAHYLSHEDQDVHETLLAISTGSDLDDPNRFSLRDTDLFLTDPNVLIERWGKVDPQLILNTKKIADRCDLEFELGKILIPTFEVESGMSEKDQLELLTWQGLAWRYGEVDEAKRDSLTIAEAKKMLDKNVIERAVYELGVMENMGYNGYFLIVQDFINWGKAEGIVFGPGRGSAAGSIVSYAIRITEVDPLKYNLLFERFLNPDRISMPDIDIDIQDSRRQEVIEYCIEKYGRDHVANIGTYGIMAARAAVRDVGRVLKVPLNKVDKLAKMVPPPIQGRHVLLKTSLKENKELQNAYKDPEIKKVMDLAIKLEGTIRNNGVHAAGVVIAPEAVEEYVPLYRAPSGVMATQYTMNPVEELGLLKFDFLGLSNLTIINNAVRIIKKVYADEIDINSIPLDDAETFKLLQRAATAGVFQLESAGMKRYLKELKPTLFEDIIAMVALYRPGPMEQLPRFIKGKNDASSIEYLHSLLEPILGETYGVMVYQEQVIKLLQIVAGYTAGEADLVRKAIGKKKRDIMEAEEPKFVSGCVEKGLTEHQAKTLWAQIQPFADYSFNKAHATCYGLIAYQTAYLKAHYPDAFMAALMTNDADNLDRLTIDISECRSLGLEVQNPDVNESFEEFAIVKGENVIRFGLAAIKNVGRGSAEAIVRERSENGKFETIEDFFVRINSKEVNKKTIESLIKTGGFDRFGISRKDLLEQQESLVAFSQKRDKEASSNQVNLFGDSEDTATHLDLFNSGQEAPDHEKLGWERELLGLYLSAHPLDKYAGYLSKKSDDLIAIKPNDNEGQQASFCGTIETMREILTKKGDKMAFATLAGIDSEVELIIFPQAFAKHSGLLTNTSAIILAKGKYSNKDRDGHYGDGFKILVDELVEVDPSVATKLAVHDGPGSKLNLKTRDDVEVVSEATVDDQVDVQDTKREIVYIKIIGNKYEDSLLKLKKLADKSKGDCRIVLVFGEKPSQRALKLPFGISLGSESKVELADIFGNENINYG